MLHFESLHRIATKLKRQITQLKKDKLVHSSGGGSGKFEEDLDKVIEENFLLQEEERRLMEGVRKLQKKKQKTLAGMSSKVKVLAQTVEPRAVSPTKHPQPRGHDVSSAQEFLMDAQNMRQNIEESNRKVSDMKLEIE